MIRKAVGLIVIICQLAIVGLFFWCVFFTDVKVKKYSSEIHNNNLDKIATSVSLLFEEENNSEYAKYVDDSIFDYSLTDLPTFNDFSVKKNEEISDDTKKDIEEEVNDSTPLVSVDASKYIGNDGMGFSITENNKTYSLNDYEFNVVVAVISGEYSNDLNDALGVVSVILNRCDSPKWNSWAGSTPYSQVIRKGQFEVYEKGYYQAYMPGGSRYGSTKYEIAKQALIDGLNGIRNNSYLGFRSWNSTGYSSKYIVSGGNRYGFN